MDLPPSGWYPDPYGVPGLLRWWDGSTWTQHTHPDGTETTDTAEPATTVEPAVQSTAAQPAVQSTAAQPAVQATTVQPAVQASMVQPTAVQPAVQPTRVQAPVQPTAYQPPTAQPPAGGDANGTQVLFLGDDAWTMPGTPTGAAAGDRYGYYRTQRRRRMLVAGGLAGGTLAALAVIALVVNNLGQSSTPAAATRPATPAHHTSAPPASPTPSATPSSTPAGSLLADGQSGMSYTQLPSPWQPTCPGGLNNQQFTWTAGESAIAGQVNGGQTTWYGVACSGPLPQQYGYNGVADLENTATNLVNTFNGTYYGTLQHNFQQEVSQPVQVSGHAGWEIKFLMSYTNAQGQGLSWNDELGAVVVADLGSGVAPAVFYTSVPGNLGESNVDSLVSSLTVNAPTQQPGGGGSPGDGGSPAAGDGGSPAAGGGDGNNP
jgi:hypothetical protein